MFTLSSVEVDFVMAVLGLSNCAETIIGNETLKGRFCLHLHLDKLLVN